MVGHTNVGKSSIIGALMVASGIHKTPRMNSQYQHISPTVSIYPRTTLGNVELPLLAFKHPESPRTRASLFDTPGVEGDSAYLNSLINEDYSSAVSLLKVGGFQRPPDSLTAGTHSP
jgi:ribosome biogenesis GTPase A